MSDGDACGWSAAAAAAAAGRSLRASLAVLRCRSMRLEPPIDRLCPALSSLVMEMRERPSPSRCRGGKRLLTALRQTRLKAPHQFKSFLSVTAENKEVQIVKNPPIKRILFPRPPLVLLPPPGGVARVPSCQYQGHVMVSSVQLRGAGSHEGRFTLGYSRLPASTVRSASCRNIR